MSFRKYGGTQFASSHNIVKSNVNTTGSFYVTENVGQPNTYINFESDISGNVNIYGDLDVSGNVNVSGDVDITGNLHVQENIDCSGNVNVDGNIDCIGDITANEFFITGPIISAPNSVVPKSYVDSVAVGLTPLAPCVLCSNVGNILLTGYGQTIDGFTISSVYDGSFVLINAQGGVGVAAITNGVYVVGSTNWQRPTELEDGDKATGTAMLIKQGVVNAGKTFVCTTGNTTSPSIIGTDPVLWHEFLSQYSLGQGLNKTVVNGNTVINVDSSLNFIQYLDNTAAGPNAGTLNIGTNTPTVNVGSTASSTLNLGSNITDGSIIIGNNSATESTTVINIGNGTGQKGQINIGNQSSNGRLINIGGTATGSTTTIQGSNLTLNPQVNGALSMGETMTAGSIQIGGTTGGSTTLAIGNGSSQTGPINLGAGASAKSINIGSVASTVNVRGTTTISNSANVNNSIRFTCDLSSNELRFLTNSTDNAFIRWYSPVYLSNSYLQIGTEDDARTTQEKIYFTQYESAQPSATYARMRIDTNGVLINHSDDNFIAAPGNYTLDVSGNGIFSGAITNTAVQPATNDSSTRVPTTAWVQSAISVSASKWTTEPNTNNIYYNSGFVGIGTTSPDYPLDVSGNGRFSNSIYLYTDASNSVISHNGSTLNLINNNADGNVVISNSTHPNNNISFDFDTSGNKITFKDGNGSTDTGFIRWYAVTVDTNSYLQIGTTDNATSNQEKIYFTQYEYLSPGTTYARMRIDTAGISINKSDNTNNFSAAPGNYTLDVSGNGIFSGTITTITPAPNENSTIVPTTQWVNTAIAGSGGSGQWTTSGNNIYNNNIGNVGIGTSTPSEALDVSGNIRASNGTVTATSYNSTSDYRIKEDVVTLNETFTVDKLRPVTYNNTKMEKQDIGLIAHELEEIYPFLVNGEKDGENFQTVNYTGLIGILIKEIQELKERVKKLEEK